MLVKKVHTERTIECSANNVFDLVKPQIAIDFFEFILVNQLGHLFCIGAHARQNSTVDTMLRATPLIKFIQMAAINPDFDTLFSSPNCYRMQT